MSEVQSVEILSTERLIGRRLRAENLADYRRLFQNARVMEFLSPDGKPLTDDEIARWLHLSIEHWDRHGFGNYAFYTVEDGQFVGRGGLKCNSTDGHDEIELGYALLPEYWGQGLGTETARAITTLAIEKLGFTSLVGCALSSNVASRRVMEKAGFQLEREALEGGVPHAFYRLEAAPNERDDKACTTAP